MPKVSIGDPKMTREALCTAQSIITKQFTNWNDNDAQQKNERAIKALQDLIDQIDILRPLGPNGKHGDRHTPECGCDVNCAHCGEPIKLFRAFGIAWHHVYPDGEAKMFGLNCGDWRTTQNIAEPNSWTVTPVIERMIP